MKNLKLAIGILFFSSLSFAQSEKLDQPCDNQLSGLVAILGSAQVSQISFGSTKEMTISGTVISSQEHLPEAAIEKFVSSGFPAYAKQTPQLNIHNCSEGVFVFMMGRGNALPQCNGAESYASPNLLSFVCINR